MKLVHHYRTLGLNHSASFLEVKTAYRQLVRQYHPDLNPADEQAITKFIAINEAYTALIEALPKTQAASSESSHAQGGAAFCQKAAAVERLNLDELKLTLEKLGIGSFGKQSKSGNEPNSSGTAQSRKDPVVRERSEEQAVPRETDYRTTAVPISTVDGAGESLSDADQVLKKDAYRQLKTLLGQQKFPRAIALVEGLSNRLPTDLEINQWRAIVYQRWGRQLINEGRLQKAKIYLKKAMQVDPDNQALSSEIKQDMTRIAILQKSL